MLSVKPLKRPCAPGNLFLLPLEDLFEECSEGQNESEHPNIMPALQPQRLQQRARDTEPQSCEHSFGDDHTRTIRIMKTQNRR